MDSALTKLVAAPTWGRRAKIMTLPSDLPMAYPNSYHRRLKKPVRALAPTSGKCTNEKNEYTVR